MINWKDRAQEYDLYISYKGKIVAYVRSYAAHQRDAGDYELVLDHLYQTDEALQKGISLRKLRHFDFVVITPMRQITYINCRWKRVEKVEAPDSWRIEKMKAVSADRKETHSQMKEGFHEHS